MECLIVLDGFIHAGSVHVKWKGRTLMIYVILRVSALLRNPRNNVSYPAVSEIKILVHLT